MNEKSESFGNNKSSIFQSQIRIYSMILKYVVVKPDALRNKIQQFILVEQVRES